MASQFTFASVLFAGLLGVILFHADYIPPIWVSVTTFVLVTLFLWQRYRAGHVGVLILVIWLVFAMPFIHIVPYLWFRFEVEDPILLWGLVVNPYMLEEPVIRLMSMMGAVGGIGIALGVSLFPSRSTSAGSGRSRQGLGGAHTLPVSLWLPFVVVGVLLSWLSAPSQTIFEATYTSAPPLLAGAGFDSAFLVSYILLSFAFCDATLDALPRRSRMKRIIIFVALAYVLVFLQLLRGDRESLPFVFGLLLVHFYWVGGGGRGQSSELPWLRLGLGVGVILAVGTVVGVVRNQLIGVADLQELVSVFRELQQSGRIGMSNLLHGTWSAVLLTPLSVAGDYVHGRLEFKYGQDYLNLLLSLPPGFVADFVGYERPVHLTQGPAQEMRYGGGGTHATVLPFRNFAMLGVLAVPAIWSHLIARYERWAVRRSMVPALALLCTIVLASPHWLWYGEKPGINAFIIWFILWIVYRVLVATSRVRSRSVVDDGEHLPSHVGG